MAEDTTNTLTLYVSLKTQDKDLLGSLRLCDNLKMAYSDHLIWLKGFTEEQIKSVVVRSIPSHKAYYELGSKLFLYGSLLPAENIPSLLWTPINRALHINLPSYNNNYFGLADQQIEIRLIPSNIEQEAFGMLTNIECLRKYIETAPAVRTKNLKWCILSSEKIIILGTPLLSIDGNALWRYKRLLLPVGYDLNYSVLSKFINERYERTSSWCCWLSPEDCVEIDSESFENLSLASFRTTINRTKISDQ